MASMTTVSRAYRIVAGALLGVALLCASWGLAPQDAFARLLEAPASSATAAPDDEAILKNESEIEQLTNAYHDSLAKVDEATGKVNELQGHIDVLQEQIPIQQARSDRAMELRYKSQQEPFAVLDALFGSSSLQEFLQQTEYIRRVSAANLAEINRLHELNEQLNSAQAEQEQVYSDAEAQASAAEAGLSAEQDKRAERQKGGIASAVEQATTQGGEPSIGVAYDGGEQPEDYREAATPETGALSDGADWHADRDEFIDEWGGRIDAYLEGSALAGQGVNFAKAAWKYNMDPRWSPAISNTESGKGAVCIRPHNAWGWGAADSDPYGLALEWETWEKAIDTHVKGLSEGYGYTITMSNAKKYCPNTWQSWYNKTLAEMSRI